jgi:transcriptional regulator with XRE-family HTH domain
MWLNISEATMTVNACEHITQQETLLMMTENTIQEIRRQNFLKLSDSFKFTKDFCEKVGILPAYFSQIKHKNKNLGNKVSRQIEKRLGLPVGYMDSSHDREEPGEINVECTTATKNLAVVIDQLPLHLKEQVRRLVYSIASEICSPPRHDNKDDESR